MVKTLFTRNSIKLTRFFSPLRETQDHMLLRLKSFLLHIMVDAEGDTSHLTPVLSQYNVKPVDVMQQVSLLFEKVNCVIIKLYLKVPLRFEFNKSKITYNVGLFDLSLYTKIL